MIKLCYDVEKYRRDILDLVKATDTIIELGCHVGGTTKLLPQTCNITAIDNSPEAQEKMDELVHVKFINADVRLHDTLSEVFKSIQSCDMLLIDLGGGYHPDTVFKVYYIWASTLKPRDVLIRNQGLIDFVNSAITTEDMISENGWIESCGDQGIPPQIKEFSLWTDKLD